jgi:hypothetical protein
MKRRSPHRSTPPCTINFVAEHISIESLKQRGFTAVDVVLSGQKNLFFTIDIEDAPQVLLFDRWTPISHRAKGRWTHYATILVKDAEGIPRCLYIQRLLLGLAFGDPRIGDHKDRNSLNNRRSNLRIATDADNTRNKTPIATKYGLPKGVRLDRRQKRKGYGAQINVDNKVIYLGYHATAKEAGDAYDKAALRYHGEFAVTNAMLRAALGKEQS